MVATYPSHFITYLSFSFPLSFIHIHLHVHSGEDEATIVNEALNVSLKYPRCFNCFMGLAAKPLPPTLRKAWAMGMKIVAKTATIGSVPRYLFLAVQCTLVVIAIVTTITNSFGDQVASYVSVGSLCVILIINILERFFYWCSHVTRSDEDGMWNFCADIIRTIVTEVFLYFAFILTLHGVTTGESYQTFFSVNSSNFKEDLGVGFALLGVIGISFVLTAGVMRMYLIVSAVKSLLQSRKSNNSNADLSIKTFLCGFCVYATAQCVAQALLIVFVGHYFHKASFPQDPLENGATFDSGLKWYFAILAEALPLGGLFLYFITTQKLVEEFPIALLLDVSPPHDRRQNISMGVVIIQFKALHSKNTSKQGICENVLSPLTSPGQGLVHIIIFGFCSNFVTQMLIISFSSHISFQVVSTLAAVLILVLDFPSLVIGLVLIILCEVFGCVLCPLLLFSCIKPNAIRDISAKDLF